MNSKISIIVPVYRAEKYLDRCIQSIVDQTYSNIEIILVDDGSPDRCPQICDEWSARDSRIQVIHQKNTGVSAARNAGIRAAQGEYLYFVDSDDWIAPNLCKKAMEIFLVNDVDIVVFDCERITETGKSLGGTETLKDGVLSVEEALSELFRGHINAYVWNKIYRRNAFQEISFPNRAAFEDMAIAYKLFLNARQIFCINEKLYYYYQRSDSVTHMLNTKNYAELYLSRWEGYVYIKPLYPDVAEIVFSRVALCALRLYDRSLWEMVDKEVYEMSQQFLRENKMRILREGHSASIWMYYMMPSVYKMLRLGKHYLGNMLRSLCKK